MGKTLKLKAPRKWVQKAAKTIRATVKSMKKDISVKSSQVAAKHIWTDGMKTSCKRKAIKKYGKT